MILRYDDRGLTVWQVRTGNLAKLMHADGHSAVLEHATFATRVFAEPADLLDCVARHGKELAKSPNRYKRRPR
ncbi:hypothetical protein [Lignipirellula cremea]|uniref:Uncharacterized protein n=1 Tax=Lignipirellula cremea TaxID=2528010 RepID=A0A518DXV8_9BACT|nr:hypothetical protein [Lignipirellula cremea]QDU96621.1 hypothetical protein Pla8534_44420 [Lignipirellula cremea]